MSHPAWPLVEDQLAQSHVVPGSALEKLIRDNQDFHLLRQEEANDQLGLPPWLRVYWRKQHPQLVYSAKDPTGGYPRVLKNIYAWMLTHQDLRPGSPQAPSEPPEPEAPTDIAGRLFVGFNKRISGAQTTPRSESDIRVNYQHVNKIIAASNDIEGGGRQAQFCSWNGGATWGQTSLPHVLNDSLHSDPTVDWTSDGTAWAITIGIDILQPNQQLRAYKSINDGATWDFDATISGTQTDADKELMWVDHSPASPFKDNIYVIYHSDLPVFVTRRTAGAWGNPVQVSGAETTGTGIGGDIKTNSAGDVFAFWPDTGSQKLLVAKSTDGGASFAQPVTMATTFVSYSIPVPSSLLRAPLIYISGGAYRTAAKNLVYATWVDLTGVPSCNKWSDVPHGNVLSPCKTRIWFSRSTDGGGTWEAPKMINNQASLNDQFHPRLVVDETDGKLVVVYYDTVGDPMRVRTDVWTQSSSNDGMTWSTPDKVTTAQTDEMVGMGFDLYNQYGDYIGLSGYAGLFYASWTDRRSGGREEIWAAPIAIVVNVGIVAGVTSTPSGVYVFAKGADGLIYWQVLGNPFSGWTAMPGTVLTDTAPAATSTDYVFIKGVDGLIYWMIRGDPGSGWTAMPGTVLTDTAPAATSTPEGVYVFIKGVDGLIYWMLLGDPFSVWTAMPSVP